MQHFINSRDRQKWAEVTEINGRIQVILRNEGEAAPYFAGYLDEMLTCSAGRPWRWHFHRLKDARIRPKPGGVQISGSLEALHFTMELSFDEHQLLNINATWENRTDRTLEDVAAGLQFPLHRREREKVTIPHMIYNNNPSADPDRVVPRLGAGPGKGFICEEHRLPIPCVNVEWNEDTGNRYFSLFSLPSYEESSEGVVRYGSLGAVREDNRTLAVAMSGVLMFNGEKDIYYIGKSATERYEDGYVNFPAGHALLKRYALDWGNVTEQGRGFREIIRKGSKLYKPEGVKPLALEEIIRLKTNALDDRWRSNGLGAAGYVKFTDSNAFGLVSKQPLHYMYGWTGQCLKLAWCDAKLGFVRGRKGRISRCREAVDFYLRESGTGIPGMRHSTYRLTDGQWDDFKRNKQPAVSSRALGETITDLADIWLLFRDNGREVPAHWAEELRESAEFFMRSVLPSGIYPAAWRLDGKPTDDMNTAAGLPCLIACAKAYRVTGKSRYLEHAETAMERYYELHAATFDRPFARSTIDARCEDKEAGMYFFLAAYELFLLTGKERYSEWAEIAADWLLTFVYMWNPAYDRGSALRDAGFNAVGWPGVSVQNHHLDVFFPSYELWRFGQLTGKPHYERWGRTIFDAMGQGICTKPGEWGFTVIGEQAEGFYQTNYHRRGYANTWNPSWVIALVLHNALRFQDSTRRTEGVKKNEGEGEGKRTVARKI
ncbi:hypothetical protein AB6A23_06050 [Paenibacillus tarimensis]